MRILRPIPALLLLLVSSRVTHAQSPAAPASQLTVHVRMVAVTASVRDKQGRLLHDLTQEDFILREDEHRVPIRYFDRDSDLPLHVGLMIDTSSSQLPFVEPERRASVVFLHAMLNRPQDEAFLVQFDDNILLLQKPTSDLPTLEHALTKLDQPHAARANGGGTLLFDAICATTQKVTGTQSGRRALIILTDGEDYGSIRNFEQATEFAQYADTTVYTIFYSSSDAGPAAPTEWLDPVSGRGIMEHISRATGGHVFAVRKNLPIEAIYAEIEHELRSQYRIGYTPPASKPLKYHRISLSTTVKHATVQARTAYFTPPE